MFGLFKDDELHIEIRPACPKCKKEFILDLKKFLPGKAHRCFACGTVSSFDPSLTDRIQKQITDLETSIREVCQNFRAKM